MYHAQIGRFVSREPSQGQPSEMDALSMDGWDILYNDAHVAKQAGERQLYGYASNNPLNNVDPSGLYTIAARVKQLTLKDKFAEWYRLEKASGAWYKALPKCPCEICLTPEGKPKTPDPKVWLDPKRKRNFPKGAWALLELGLRNAFDTPPDLHPGAVWDMRQKTPTGRYGNQCMYDKHGKLITGGVGAGTADKRYYGPVDFDTWTAKRLVGEANKATQMWKHWQHDVIPFWAAWILDGKPPPPYGRHVAMYLAVRPPVIDEKCKKNVVGGLPRPKPKAK